MGSMRFSYWACYVFTHLVSGSLIWRIFVAASVVVCNAYVRVASISAFRMVIRVSIGRLVL